MLEIKVENDFLRIGERLGVSFQRTLRIPDDGRDYPLPPGLGPFPLRRIEDYADRVPPSWREHGGVFLPMYQREAMWLSFEAAHWKPNAVKIAIGKVNAVTGKPWSQELDPDDQDYLVCPDQPWLDGINAGDGTIRQFVAMPLGMGYTVEAQVTGKEDVGGLQIIAFEPKPGRFPDQPPVVHQRMESELAMDGAVACCAPSAAPAPAVGTEMGLAGGGSMVQKIYTDDHGPETWDQEHFGRVFVHICNSMMYREITGEEPPETPVTAKTYTTHHYPWFELYDEKKGDLPAPKTLEKVKSVKEMDAEKGFSEQQDDSPVEIGEEQVVKLGEPPDPTRVKDGDW